MIDEPIAVAARGRANSLAEVIVGAVGDRSARGIAAAVGRLISAGELAVHTRLPTVRELSRELGVSPTTVSEAWQSLAAVGAIDARGRQGTYVRQPTGPSSPRRYRRVTEGPGRFALDLSTGTPDPALLPDLGPVIARVNRQSLTSSYLDQPVLPQLAERVRADWPFVPEELTMVDGAMDALDRVAGVVVRLGDRVVVEHPTFPPLLDLLELLGAEVIGVDLDEQGMRADALAAQLQHGVKAVFLQPRAHNPTGVTLTAQRGAELAAVLAGAVEPGGAGGPAGRGAASGPRGETIIVEDDHSGDIASGALVSLGAWLPHRTVHIRSYSKSHGPDLRLAAVGGAGEVVSAVANRRLLGPGWSSRILQAVLLEMLGHQPTIDAVAAARIEYAARRAAVSRVLADAGVGFTGTDGINLWMQVADERSALLTLAAQGIGAAPGEPFMVRDDTPSLRVTVGLIDHDLQASAHRLAAAAGNQPTRRGQR
ncbi:MAG: aminotransferase class I/II-fold pyridoxal phosphate-dependent enzyme [Actinomycetota bacterium]|nr:aminotransferase class I/II-fold pyridoxal phosphate-dependent enzyme [Actinomycetota bacterium]